MFLKWNACRPVTAAGIYWNSPSPELEIRSKSRADRGMGTRDINGRHCDMNRIAGALRGIGPAAISSSASLSISPLPAKIGIFRVYARFDGQPLPTSGTPRKPQAS
jgi:hypothetical protein